MVLKKGPIISLVDLPTAEIIVPIRGVGWHRPTSKFMLFYSILFSYFQRVFLSLGRGGRRLV